MEVIERFGGFVNPREYKIHLSRKEPNVALCGFYFNSDWSVRETNHVPINLCMRCEARLTK